MKDLVFYLVGLMVIVSAAGVAFSKNIVYSAFALLATFGGTAGLFILLGADFLAGTQLLIYVGAILVLILFAVMLTNKIGDVNVSNQSLGRVPGLIIALLVVGTLIGIAHKAPWAVLEEPPYEPTTHQIGNALLTTYLLPFELVSLVLLGSLVGAVMIARRAPTARERREIARRLAEERAQAAGPGPAPAMARGAETAPTGAASPGAEGP